MSKRRKVQYYVIYDGPEQQEGPGTRYFDKRGGSTDIKKFAARFIDRLGAERFAKEHDIDLDCVLNYIGSEYFDI
jgi:hypothetical protein